MCDEGDASAADAISVGVGEGGGTDDEASYAATRATRRHRRATGDARECEDARALGRVDVFAGIAREDAVDDGARTGARGVIAVQSVVCPFFVFGDVFSGFWAREKHGTSERAMMTGILMSALLLLF